MPTRAEVLWNQFYPGSKCEVSEVVYKCGDLTIHMAGETTHADVQFKMVYGYRVLDEQDLLEFWPTYSLANGWLYEVIQGGWMDLESTREGCFALGTRDGLREFLIVGEDTCVSVFSINPPTVHPYHAA